MKLGARSLLPSDPEINSVTLNVILLEVFLSSRNPLGYRHHNLRFAPFHDNLDCVRDGDDGVLRRSKPASLDCYLHLRKYADCGNAGNSRRAHRKREAVRRLAILTHCDCAAPGSRWHRRHNLRLTPTAYSGGVQRPQLHESIALL